MTSSPAATRFEAAHQRLREDIEQGVYAPRERLVEVEVAERLGISRSTLRAVLVRLAEEGLVELEANRGARVRSFSLESALQKLEVRAALEGLVAASAARHASEAEIEQMAEIVGAMECAAAADDLLRYSQLNGQFHRMLLACSQNPELRRLLEMLHFPLIRYQYRTVLVPGRKALSLEEHRRILQCVACHDAAAAEEAARSHIQHVRDTLQSSAELLQF